MDKADTSAFWNLIDGVFVINSMNAPTDGLHFWNM